MGDPWDRVFLVLDTWSPRCRHNKYNGIVIFIEYTDGHFLTCLTLCKKVTLR